VTPDRRCPVCGAGGARSFFVLEAVPVHQNLTVESRREAAACPTGTIDLAFCEGCGFIFNARFEPGLLRYSPEYENSQCCSPGFRQYLDQVARHLVDRRGLLGKRVVEIGCGKGDFLALLCQLGVREGIGFDPAFEPERTALPASVVVIRDLYSERHAGQTADLFCCRHTLEHVGDPGGFVRQVRGAIGGQPSAVFFEVPDVRWILDSLAFWDVCYEHCNYFSPASLTHLFEAGGFGAVEVSAAFGGQYLWLDAVPGSTGRRPQGPAAAAVAHIRDKVAAFESGYERRMTEAREEIDDVRRLGRRAVVWGAGAKGVMFLNELQMRPESIEYVVDINPRKQRRFIPGTGQEIVAPEALREYKPDTVFVMNPNYVGEVQGQLNELGLRPAVVSL
jgi:SAM-dependent methyltransferase